MRGGLHRGLLVYLAGYLAQPVTHTHPAAPPCSPPLPAPAMGLAAPNELQQRAIPPMLTGRDTVVQARAGAGKSWALKVALLQRLDTGAPGCQALLLVPCRELAQNTQRVLEMLGGGMGARARACIGGVPMREDAMALRRENAPHVVVGTPGRVLALLQCAALALDRLRVLALDEADRVLDSGFAEHLEEIFSRHTPQAAQLVCLSVPQPSQPLLDFTARFFRSPLAVRQAAPEDISALLQRIRHYCVHVEGEGERLEVLVDLCRALPQASRIAVFCSTQALAQELAGSLHTAGAAPPVAVVHCGMNENERQRELQGFGRAGSTSRILVATDLGHSSSSDLSVDNVVIGYNLPQAPLAYLTRVACSARLGRSGLAITIACPSDKPMLARIER